MFLPVSPNFTCIAIDLTNFAGYWLQYRKELCVLVSALHFVSTLFLKSLSLNCHPLPPQLWEALMTWRSMSKLKAHNVVPHFYKLGNQFTAEENLAIAQDLIKGSSFIWDGVDEEVSQP